MHVKIFESASVVARVPTLFPVESLTVMRYPLKGNPVGAVSVIVTTEFGANVAELVVKM